MDYDYLARSLASLSGLPVRIYENDTFVTLYHHTKFKPDLAILEEPRIFQNSGSVSYTMTDVMLFFGLLRSKTEPWCLVVGPAFHTVPKRNTVNAILRSIGEPLTRSTELLNYLTALPPFPLRNFLQILITMNYAINEEKLSVTDLIVEEALPVPPLPQEPPERETDPHNTMDLENLMLSFVEHGRTEEMSELYRQPVEGRAGPMASDALRQQKNTLICTATLVSRAAIRGGMDHSTAFTLTDTYIQKAELLKSYTDVDRLTAQMVMDFTQRVAELQSRTGASPVVARVRAHVLSHLSEAVTVEELSRALGMNRTSLAERFQADIHTTPGKYIAAVKIDEAKRLLAISKKPLGEIADALGFSSQSHFQKAFKTAVGITPLEYRQKQK